MENRINMVGAIAGNRGTGKTDFLKNLLRASQMPKKLIIDTFDSPVWHTMETWDNPQGQLEPISEIQPHQLKFWKSGTYRMFSSDTDELMFYVQNDLRNCITIFEDATKYIGSKLTKDIKKFVLDSKQKNLDLVFVFHSLKDIPNDLIRVMDFITICKTGDKYGSHLRSKYPDSVEDAHAKVMKATSKFEKITLQISS